MRPAPIFYLVVFYSFLQLGWWTYLLVELNNEVASLKTEMLIHSSDDHEYIMQKKQVLDQKLHARWMMVIGEGSVFTLFMIMGIFHMRRAMRREAEFNRQQNNFLLSVTHELKSPIASIKLYLQTLMKRDIERDKQQSFMEHAIQDTDRLNLLVDNLLIAARLEGQTYVYRKERLNFSELLNEQCNRFQAQQTKNITFELCIEEGVYILADAVAMESLINNLVENAIKYSPTESRVKITLLKNEKNICFKIHDEGPGISDSEKKLLFRKFYRIGNEQTRTNKGTGLGLYIVKHIVNGHGGKINIANNSPKGSIFEVLFPISSHIK